MQKIIWPIIAFISLVLSTFAFILGSKVIERSQKAPPISITYPEGYTDLPELERPVSKSKNSKAKVKSR